MGSEAAEGAAVEAVVDGAAAAAMQAVMVAAVEEEAAVQAVIVAVVEAVAVEARLDREGAAEQVVEVPGFCDGIRGRGGGAAERERDVEHAEGEGDLVVLGGGGPPDLSQRKQADHKTFPN